MIFHSTLRVKLFIADETSVFSSFKIALKWKKKKSVITEHWNITSLQIEVASTIHCICTRVIKVHHDVWDHRQSGTEGTHPGAQAQMSLQPRHTGVGAATTLRTPTTQPDYWT